MYRKGKHHQNFHRIAETKRILFLVMFFITFVPCKPQTILGTTGMMNIPSADMRAAGTFDGGASFIQKDLLYKKTYNTYLYYVSFTPFSWIELTLRETLIKTRKSAQEPDKIGFYQQDRSTSVRLRPITEGKYWPSIVIAANDIYSDHGGSKYACIYGVATKHFPIASVGTIEATVGYAYPRKKGETYDGVMGGVSFSPAFFPDMRVMGEYDTQGYNFGVGAFLFRHLNLTCFTREFSGVNATISYQYTIPY